MMRYLSLITWYQGHNTWYWRQ